MSKRALLLPALAATPADLERLVRGVMGTAVDTAVSQQRPAPEQWSIADVLCHLVLVEGRYLARLQLVVREAAPAIACIQPDPARHDLTQPAMAIAANFRQARQETVAFLQELKAGDWQRTAVHPTWGKVSLRSLVQHLVDHDTAHLNQIIEIQQRMRKTVDTEGGSGQRQPL